MRWQRGTTTSLAHRGSMTAALLRILLCVGSLMIFFVVLNTFHGIPLIHGNRLKPNRLLLGGEQRRTSARRTTYLGITSADDQLSNADGPPLRTLHHENVSSGEKDRWPAGAALLNETSLLQLAAMDNTLDKLLASRANKYPDALFRYIALPQQRPPLGLQKVTSKKKRAENIFFKKAVPHGVCLDCYDVVSIRPRVYWFHDVFTAEEADALRSLGEPLLSRSGVFAKQSIQRSVRSSFGARLPSSDPTAAALNERLLFIINHFSTNKSTRTFRAGYSERLEMLKYEGSQTYYGHLDNFGGLDGPIARDRVRKIEAYRKKLNEVVEIFSTNATGRGLHGQLDIDVDDAQMKSTACSALLHQWKPISEPLLDRGATMIAFLNTLNESIPGGHTTFPFAAAADSDIEAGRWEDDVHATPAARKRWKLMLDSFHSSKESACNRSRVVPRNDSKHDGDAHGGQGLASTGARTHEPPHPPPFLAIKPKVGDVVLFYDTYENGVSDPFALHSGCPPITEAALSAAVLDELSKGGATAAAPVGNESGQQLAQVRERIAKRYTKVIATKWFMVPIIPGQPRPPLAMCPRH